MIKKKFLWILPYYPYPALSGGNVRIYNLIKYLSQYYDIDLLSYYDKEISASDISEMEKFCKKVVVVERKQYEGDLPLIFQYYTSPEMTKELKSILQGDYDFIQMDFLTMAYSIFQIKELTDVPVFFTEHDMSSFDFDRCFHNRHLPEKERYVEWLRMHEVIDKIYPNFDAVFTVSHNDARLLKEKFPTLTVSAVPTGTDCSYFNFIKNTEGIESLVYVGHYLHYPNVDSVKYFIKDIFPHVLRDKPNLKFIAVGSVGETVLKDIQNENVEVTGTVEDIRNYLHSNAVFVAPIRLGIGIRGKILEAMSCGMPVVTSLLGADGIGAHSGGELLVGENPVEFAKNIIKIIDDKKLKDDLVSNADKFVRENYDWPVVVQNMVSVYDSLVS